MKPTVGRIVLYTLTEQDAIEINQRRRDANAFRRSLTFPIESGEPGRSGHIEHVGNAASPGDIYPRSSSATGMRLRARSTCRFTSTATTPTGPPRGSSLTTTRASRVAGTGHLASSTSPATVPQPTSHHRGAVLTRQPVIVAGHVDYDTWCPACQTSTRIRITLHLRDLGRPPVADLAICAACGQAHMPTRPALPGSVTPTAGAPGCRSTTART
jgi:hypothetical protein